MDDKQFKYMVEKLETIGVLAASLTAFGHTTLEIQARLLAAAEGRDLAEVEAEVEALLKKHVRFALDRHEESSKKHSTTE